MARIDLDALKIEIVTNRAQTTLHGQARQRQRIGWDAIRASFLGTITLVEDYPMRTPWPAVLVLTWASDGRPIHSEWAWNGGPQPPILITVYQPDEPAHKAEWNATFTRRVTPPTP